MQASIYLEEIRETPPGQFEVVFAISTDDCKKSACAGFSATLVIEVAEGEYADQRYSFGGWSVGESSNGEFTIVRKGPLSGVSLNDVQDIEQAEFVCHD